VTAEVRESLHDELPRTAAVKHPVRLPLHSGRASVTAVIRRRWDLQVRHRENVPGTGPVVMAANHIGFMDGPLMAIVGPRPVHALTKLELFDGALGAFLHFSGQIPIDRTRPDPRALRTAIRVLRDGGAAGVFPESTRGAGDMARAAGGAAYLALVTGATVVPMSFLGTRLPGTASTFPPAGSTMVMSYGAPIEVEPLPWPRQARDVAELTEQIRHAIIATTAEAVAATGVDLPGPLPEGASEDDELPGDTTSKDIE
jgi:1-acyl-sn-glycerol-3-phosphate acyltransferase